MPNNPEIDPLKALYIAMPVNEHLSIDLDVISELEDDSGRLAFLGRSFDGNVEGLAHGRG